MSAGSIPKILLTALLGVLFISAAAAAEFRIATVNLEKVFNDYYRTKIIDKDLEDQSKLYRNYIARQAEQLRKDEEAYRQQLDASLNAALLPAERQKRQEEARQMEEALKKRRAELEQYASTRAKLLQENARKKRQQVIDEIKAEISRRAAIDGYALVLDSSGMTMNETSLVLYSIDKIDITGPVITELNRGAAKPAAEKSENKQ